MPRYLLRVGATAEIEENWIAEGATPEEAFEKVTDGSAEFVDDHTVGEERDRMMDGWMLAPEPEPVSDGELEITAAAFVRDGLVLLENLHESTDPEFVSNGVARFEFVTFPEGRYRVTVEKL